jgi:hypothetical protein
VVINLQNEAEVAGLKKAVQGFKSASHFAQYHILTRLSPALREIIASDESEFGKIFSNYMTPPPATNAKPAGPVAERPPNGTAKKAGQ